MRVRKGKATAVIFLFAELVEVQKNVRVPKGLGLAEAVAKTATFAFGR
ncbi:MAG: hypothetical protein HRT70_05615 [Flavobacteriaceae bacterium]|nr:hypothetical protein [Flavobacteriaceae bacterium]